MVRWIFIFVLFVTGAIWGVSDATAQVRRYTPPGGNPLPAALDYFRQDVGVLDPYNTFVAPRKQLRNQLEVMAAREYDDFRSVQSENSLLRRSAASPTGTSAGFMNYSHYYSRTPVGRRR